MSNPNRKDENIRRANRVIQTRSFVLMLLMGVGMFVLLFFQLFDLQIVRHEELQSKAVNQQTRRTVVTASRGTIYDRTGNIMAISASAETIILSPLEIDRAVNDKDAPVSWTKDTLAAGLAELLDGDAAAIRKRMDNTKSQYEVIKLRAEEDTANAVRAYINENKIVGVHLVADAKRYYPYGSLASHVIGFVGDDNTGLYGLEARYEQELEGQSGMVVSTKDNAGNDMMYAYEQYFAAQNGSDLTLTLDTTIQYYLEKGLDTMTDKFAAANGATGIVLDAMALQSKRADHRYDALFGKFLREYCWEHFRNQSLREPYLVEHYSAETGEMLSDEADYNHSYFIDLLIRHVAGFTPTEEGFEVDPVLIGLKHFDFDDLPLRGHTVRVALDERLGFSVSLDGKEIFHAAEPKKYVHAL